jgi:heme a synthase
MNKGFTRFAWVVLAYNLPVILWGAYVRVSFSGDGCGANWPTCNGQVLPGEMTTPTLIEFTHRMMTSVDAILLVTLCTWAFLAFPKRHAVRRYAVLSVIFLFIEALLGAGLVLFRHVARDESVGRAWYLSAHLVNTMLLLAAMTATAWLASTATAQFKLARIPRLLWGSLAVTVAVSVTGAIAALGDTLFPSASLAEGMRRDFSSASSLLLRLRLVHPLIAILGAAYLIWAAAAMLRGKARGKPEGDRVRMAGARVIALALFQITLGAVNLSLLAPVWMQLIHLLMADIVWVAVVLLALETGKTISRLTMPNQSRGQRERFSQSR